MIVKTINKRRYGNFFLATEAPSDEPTATTEEISRNDNDEFDDINVDMNDNDDQTEPEVQDNTDDEDTDNQQDDDINTDFNNDDEQPSDDTQDDGEEEQEQPDNTEDDNTDNTTDDVDTDFNNDDEQPSDDTQNDGEEAPDDGGGGVQGNDKNGPGLEYDSTRKFVLYNKFISLYNGVENYTSKLENSLKDNAEENQLIITSVKYLRSISSLTYDYMIMKYDISSYVQSLMFYQKLVVATQMVFKILSEFNKEENAISNTKQ